MAWITALRADPATGLWGTFKWTDKGAQAVSARRYRFVSAAWHVDGSGRPDALSSVALTNKPNIPGKPILNRESAGGASADQTRKPAMEELKKALGLASDADDAAVLAAVQALAKKVTDLEAAQLNAEADAFAEENKDKAKDPEVLKNAYKKDPELAKSLVLNMKDPEPAKAPEPAKKPGEIATAATRILTNRAPVGPGAGMTKEQAREKLASLPHAEQAEFYRQNAALIDG
jgi:phage I-like protein